MLRHLIPGILFLLFNGLLQAQGNVQDCVGAIPVCQTNISNPNSYSGVGNVPNEINTTTSCIGGGETNSVWYALTIQSPGDLSFLLSPITPSDYDWAVFNLTNASCSDIFTDASLLVSCNFQPVNGPTGPNGNTSGGAEFNPVIPVQAGETYMIFINNYSANNGGFDLDFSTSTAQIFDNTAPSITGLAAPLACNVSNITLQLSEPVSCSGFSAGMFALNGPSGNIGIASVSCTGGGQYSDQLLITLSQPLTVSGAYSLSLNSGSISDLCGNTMTPGSTAPLNFNFTGISLSNPATTASLCYAPTGSASVTVNGGSPPLSYSWSPGAGPNGPVWNNIAGGTYTLTVSDANGCSATETFVVPTQYDFSIATSQLPDTCGKGAGSATVIVTGTSGPFTIYWPGPDTNLTSVNGLYGDSAYIVTVTDANNCTLTDTIFVQDIRNDSLLSVIQFLHDTVDILMPYATLINASQYYQDFMWLYLDQSDSLTVSPTIELPDGGSYPISLIVYDQNGCTDTSTRDIYVASEIYYYIPNAFTPNGNGRNEIWQPKGIGFDTTTYVMRIFDGWGNMLYMTRDKDAGWDGRDRQGKMCPPGTYVYRITMEGIEIDDYGDFKGHIILIR